MCFACSSTLRPALNLCGLSEIHTQAAVGTGRGVLGDTKKLSVFRQGSTFLADDQHRPPILTTFDLRGNLGRAISVWTGGALFASDIATDADNNWTDPAVVDAHVHVGWAYDYFFKRLGRRGLDNRDRPVIILTNAVSQQGALNLPDSQVSWALNASWCGFCGPRGEGVIFFGNGIPPGIPTTTGNNYTYFAGALDIAAHELTHGVTASSSRLEYRDEPGALNEAFSDIIGTSVEFFYHPPGTGPRRADYIIGEDISRALVPGARDGDRSMENPAAYGQPDHYSRRLLVPLADDNGGVHSNLGIANHAFYLAIEGGTNRTSGLSVQGVGAANREQIEKVFYRAFVFLLPSSATFSTARAMTIQAARDLYGAGSSPERAVSQAWTAVGVQEIPPCIYTLFPTAVSFSAAGGPASTAVTTNAGCAWTATSNASWLTVTGGSTGNGSGTVSFSVAANTGSARTGSLTIAGQTFTIAQDAVGTGSCTFSIQPTSQSIGAVGGTGSSTVTTTAGCAWTATSNAFWITVTSGATGNGTGTVNFNIAANTNAARSGTLVVAGQTFTVNQAEAICTYSINPTSQTVGCRRRQRLVVGDRQQRMCLDRDEQRIVDYRDVGCVRQWQRQRRLQHRGQYRQPPNRLADDRGADVHCESGAALHLYPSASVTVCRRVCEQQLDDDERQQRMHLDRDE